MEIKFRPEDFTVTSVRRREPPHLQFWLIDRELKSYIVHLTEGGQWTASGRGDYIKKGSLRSALIRACTQYLIQYVAGLRS